MLRARPRGELVMQDQIAALTDAEEEVDGAPLIEAGLEPVLQQSYKRRHARTTGGQHDWFCRVASAGKVAQRLADLHDVTGFQIPVQPGGAKSGGHVLAGRRRSQ